MGSVKIDDSITETINQWARVPATYRKRWTGHPLAGWLHQAGLCYCSRNQTDGFISLSAVLELVNVQGIAVMISETRHEPLEPGDNQEWEDVEVHFLVDSLVEGGLWERVPLGYRIPSYLDHNPRAKRAAAGRKGGQAKAQKALSIG